VRAFRQRQGEGAVGRGGYDVDAAEAREKLLRVAARDREAYALGGDPPDAHRMRAAL
jgi:hypothetical protein